MKVKTILTAMLFLCATAMIMETAKSQTTSNDMKEVCNFLKECGEYYLATVETTVEGDQPRVRPFGTAAIYENRLYIQTGKRKNVAKQMFANPKIEICAFNKQAGTWLRISATVVPDERVEAKEFMLNEYPSLKSMYSATDDNTLVLYLKDATATFFSFSGEAKEVKF